MYEFISTLNAASHLLAGKAVGIEAFNLYLLLVKHSEYTRILEDVHARFPTQFEERCVLGLIQVKEKQ